MQSRNIAMTAVSRDNNNSKMHSAKVEMSTLLCHQYALVLLGNCSSLSEEHNGGRSQSLCYSCDQYGQSRVTICSSLVSSDHLMISLRCSNYIAPIYATPWVRSTYAMSLSDRRTVRRCSAADVRKRSFPFTSGDIHCFQFPLRKISKFLIAYENVKLPHMISHGATECVTTRKLLDENWQTESRTCAYWKLSIVGFASNNKF